MHAPSRVLTRGIQGCPLHMSASSTCLPPLHVRLLCMTLCSSALTDCSYRTGVCKTRQGSTCFRRQWFALRRAWRQVSSAFGCASSAHSQPSASATHCRQRSSAVQNRTSSCRHTSRGSCGCCRSVCMCTPLATLLAHTTIIPSSLIVACALRCQIHVVGVLMNSDNVFVLHFTD